MAVSIYIERTFFYDFIQVLYIEVRTIFLDLLYQSFSGYLDSIEPLNKLIFDVLLLAVV